MEAEVSSTFLDVFCFVNHPAYCRELVRDLRLMGLVELCILQLVQWIKLMICYEGCESRILLIDLCSCCYGKICECYTLIWNTAHQMDVSLPVTKFVNLSFPCICTFAPSYKMHQISKKIASDIFWLLYGNFETIVEWDCKSASACR